MLSACLFLFLGWYLRLDKTCKVPSPKRKDRTDWLQSSMTRIDKTNRCRPTVCWLCRPKGSSGTGAGTAVGSSEHTFQDYINNILNLTIFLLKEWTLKTSKQDWKDHCVLKNYVDWRIQRCRYSPSIRTLLLPIYWSWILTNYKFKWFHANNRRYFSHS